MDEENNRLVELFTLKHKWEQKIIRLTDEVRWRVVWFLPSFLGVFLYVTLKVLVFEGGKLPKASKFNVIWCLVFLLVFYLFSIISLMKCVNLLYYRLPRYRQKICQIDHKIIEELTNLLERGRDCESKF